MLSCPRKRWARGSFPPCIVWLARHCRDSVSPPQEIAVSPKNLGAESKTERFGVVRLGGLLRMTGRLSAPLPGLSSSPARLYLRGAFLIVTVFSGAYLHKVQLSTEPG